jgi:hypothetical protein
MAKLRHSVQHFYHADCHLVTVMLIVLLLIVMVPCEIYDYLERL